MEPQVNLPEETDATSPDAVETEPRSVADWDDTRLVRECLGGNENAWDGLIRKYKRLIYSIPMKYGATTDDAADIFQAVCLELFSDLGNLRKTESLKSWLITVTAHQAYHWKKRQRPGDVELDNMEPELAEAQVPAAGVLPPEMLQQIQEEQIVRESLRKLPPRCEHMIRLLFYSDPPLPYTEVAQRLGLATGSIGFIRGRCLKRLQKILTETGF